MKLKKRGFFFFFFLCLFLNTFFVFAQTRELEIEYLPLTGIEMPTVSTPVEAEDLVRYVRYIFNFAILAGIILALLFLILAGLRYLYSGDNPQIKSEAKNQIFSALFGIFLLLISYNLLAAINPDFIVLNPLTLRNLRVFPGQSIIRQLIDLFRGPKINLQEVLERLQPTQLPLELVYPEMRGFRPTVIPFTQSFPDYPLERLIAQYVNYLYNWAIVIGIILALVVLILGGVKYLISRGNISLITEAKNQIFASFLGLLLLLASFGILRALRPEFTLLHPSSLPEIEISIPEGVYLCRERAPLSFRNTDLFEAYIRNEFNKKIRKNPSFIFTNKLKAELTLFIQLFCYHLTNSQNLPPEIAGQTVQVSPEEIRNVVEKTYGTSTIPGLTDQEMQQLIFELSQPTTFPTAAYMYVHGPYGVIFHGKKDFKGWAKIYLIAEYIGVFPEIVSIQGNFIFNFRDLAPFFQQHRPASITIFKDRVFDCWLKTKKDSYSQANITECLGIRLSGQSVNFEDFTFYFFPLLDFGGFEEKGTAEEYYVLTFNFLGFKTLGGEPGFPEFKTVATKMIGNRTTNSDCDPCRSFKVSSEGNWIVLITTWISPWKGEYPTAIFNNSQRNLEETYARALRECKSSPCIRNIFIWPGEILKPVK